MSIFSKVAMPRPQHNTFDLSHSRKFSMSIGKITPICVTECVPGDSFNIKTTQLLRFAPLLAPVMHESSVYCHFFFVPNRILWENWEEFITGGEDAANPAYVPPVFPYYEPNGPYVIDIGSLGDYLGLPNTDMQDQKFSVLPFMAYAKIYNEYYRDQNLVDKITDEATDGENGGVVAANTVQNRAWQHDYFTSALPWTQKGPEATIPLGTTAPLINLDGPVANFASQLKDSTDGTLEGGETLQSSGGLVPGMLTDGVDTNYRQLDITPHTEVDLSDATAAGINDLRRAFRLQEWLERNARGGSRYIEVILAHFGVQSSDSRLQRPEFLGGSATPITISEVLQTSESGLSQEDPATTPTPQANMAGHGVSVGSSNYVSYKCEEHGYIMGLMTVMPKSAYQQGIPKHFSKFDKFEYYWPSFANIGEQPILNQELYCDITDGENENTFGYTPRYAEYKYLPSTVHGEFRSTLDFWHMGRIFAARPTLNSTFVECEESEVDRIFAVTEGDENLYVYLHNKIKARRPMPYFGTPIV